MFLLKPTVFPTVLLHLLLFKPPSLNHLLLISPMNLQSLFHIKYVAHKGNPMPLWKLLAFCSLKSRCDCSTAHDFYDIEVALPGRTIFIFKVHHIWVTRRHPMLTRTGLLSVGHGICGASGCDLRIYEGVSEFDLNHSPKNTNNKVAPWNDWTCVNCPVLGDTHGLWPGKSTCDWKIG